MTAEQIAWFGSVLAFALAMAATPGPNNAMVAASGARFGVKRTLPHMLGITLGFPVMVLAVAIGAGQALADNPWLHGALRWVGAAYMLWLAWSIARPHPATAHGVEGHGAGAHGVEAGRRPLGLLPAALFQWVNPKAWIIAVGAVVTYSGTGAPLAQTLTMAAIFGAVTLPAVLLWTLVGAGAASLLRTERALRRFDWAMAALLVASLVPMLFE